MLSTYLRLVRDNRNYRLLWIAQVVSELGDWFYALAVYNLLLELTGNKAQSVALAVVLQVLPQLFAAPTAGVLNDRISRKSIMIGADLVRFFVVLGMLGVRTPGMVWLVYPLLLVETVGAAFFEPAHSSVIPNIVAEGEVLAANALASITWSVCLAAGASLGGVAAVLLGRDAVFLLNAFSFLASAWLIRRMRFAEPHTAGLPPLRARDLVDFTPVLEGARYIRADSRLLTTVFVKFGLGLMGANNVLLPILGQRVFPVKLAGVDPGRGAILGMSLLMGARGVGSLLGPLAAGWWAGGRHSRLRTRHFRRLRAGRRGLCVARPFGIARPGGIRGDPGACRRLHQLGLLHHAAPVLHRGPFSRARLLRRPGPVRAQHVGQQLPGRRGHRPRRPGPRLFRDHGPGHAASRRRVGPGAGRRQPRAAIPAARLNHVLPLHHQPVVPLCLGRVANMLSSAAIFSAAVLEQ
jgi:hypothetical protein